MQDEVLAAIVAAIEQRETIAVLTVTAADGIYAHQLGRHLVVWQAEAHETVGGLAAGALSATMRQDAKQAMAQQQSRQFHYNQAEGSLSLFIDVQVQPPHLIIVGAGHIAAPLAAVAQICAFEVTVLDDRAQYASPQRFPTAERVIAGPFREELRRLRRGKPTFDANTYLVLVTRGHQYDVECLLEVLDDPVAYIGMIGSQRRIRAVYELLEREQAIPAQKFDRIHAPVGLAIGAQTPAEIAVCIMAEIINVQRGGPAQGLNAQLRRRRQVTGVG